MKVTEAELQDLYRRQSGGSGRESCLSSEELTALARGELDAEERRRGAAHLADCSDCSLELRMARGLEPWAADLADRLELDKAPPKNETLPDVGDLVTRQRRGVSGRGRLSIQRWAIAAIAAVLALMAVSVYMLVPRALAPGSAGDVTRGDVTRGNSAAALQPAVNAVVERVPERFIWSAQLGATGYRVRLFDARAELLWESELLQANEASLPSASLDRLESPGSYSWTVEVEGPAQRSRLGPFSFRIGQE